VDFYCVLFLIELKLGNIIIQITYLNTYFKNMGVRKSDEKNIRKITRVGKTSLSVTIPVEIVGNLKWRERQKVVVRQSGKRIIIEDWKP